MPKKTNFPVKPNGPDTPLNKMLRNQSILLGFLREKLNISRFLRWGFENELPILYENAFLHFSSHMCLRSAIVDMCALFDDHKFQAFNFHQLLNEKKKFIKELDEESKEDIKIELDRAIKIFSPVKVARDKEIAHYRFDEPHIRLSHELLPSLIELYSLAAEIHDIALWGQFNEETRKFFSIGIRDEDGSQQDYLIPLQRLLKRVNKTEYKKLWEQYLKSNSEVLS